MATQLAKLNQYIPVDLLRDQDETIDITDKFKGRVGDVDSYIKLNLTKQNQTQRSETHNAYPNLTQQNQALPNS